MAAPNPIHSRLSYRVTQINSNLHTARWSESSVQCQLNRSGFRRGVGNSHAKTIPRHGARPETSNSSAWPARLPGRSNGHALTRPEHLSAECVHQGIRAE